MANDLRNGDYASFYLNAVGLMIPGVTGLGMLSKAYDAYDALRFSDDIFTPSMGHSGYYTGEYSPIIANLVESQKLPPLQGKSLSQIKKTLEINGWNFGYWGHGANVEVWVNNVDSSIIRLDKTGNVVTQFPNAVGHMPHYHRQAWDEWNAPSFDDFGNETTDIVKKHILITNYWFDQYRNSWLHYNRTGDDSWIKQLYFMRFKK
ncbi:MAG: hypothetical protein JNK81_12275 [Anaerolineales bacterium]|nr:hypothetical protein [Anaerolineales bacterium]